MNPWLSHTALALVAFTVGWAAHPGPPSTADTSRDAVEGETPEGEEPAREAGVAGAEVEAEVTGLGGIFFKSEDPMGLSSWYRSRLGVGSANGTFVFTWLHADDPQEVGYTVWGVFPDSTGYFDPGEAPFMVNFRVTNLAGLLESLREQGVDIVGEVEEHPNGRFAWILDPEGRKIELWEPLPSAEDPYL